MWPSKCPYKKIYLNFISLLQRGPKMSLQKTHLNFISAPSSEDPILLGKYKKLLLGKREEAHHFTWKNTKNHQKPTILLGKTQRTHQVPTTWKKTRNPPGAHHDLENTRNPPAATILGKTQGTHQVPTYSVWHGLCDCLTLFQEFNLKRISLHNNFSIHAFL